MIVQNYQSILQITSGKIHLLGPKSRNKDFNNKGTTIQLVSENKSASQYSIHLKSRVDATRALFLHMGEVYKSEENLPYDVKLHTVQRRMFFRKSR